MQLKDKVALVTGAASGIGKAIALRFAREGAKVAINTRPGGNDGKPVLDEARRTSPDSFLAPASVDNREQVEGMVNDIVQRLGRIDIVVNNAGIEIQKPFLEATDEEWNKVISVNLFGSYLVSQVAARQMVKQGPGGKLIFISSVHEDIPFVGYTSYCASKGGIRMMMRNLAMELAEHRINVNNIAPGAIATPINQKVLDNPQEKENAISEIPWGRFGRPEEVAAVAVFLASSESDYVTGSTYYVDGGLTQQVTKY
ncbi:MAG TPA: glucose 1-dehydrogenase [Verrucomicrobiae bacterium]|nr:glucose 1-dehydrogenase [Verrucomicrobiae bacterium]